MRGGRRSDGLALESEVGRCIEHPTVVRPNFCEPVLECGDKVNCIAGTDKYIRRKATHGLADLPHERSGNGEQSPDVVLNVLFKQPE